MSQLQKRTDIHGIKTSVTSTHCDQCDLTHIDVFFILKEPIGFHHKRMVANVLLQTMIKYIVKKMLYRLSVRCK